MTPIKNLSLSFSALFIFCASANAQISHHKITGEYNAQTVIAFNEPGGQATVKDKVILELDWDRENSKLIGPISIQNFNSETSDLRNVERSCPPPTAKGTYEHITVTSATEDGSGAITLTGTRSFPEVAVTADCQGAWHKRTVPAKQTMVTEFSAMIELDEGTFTVPVEEGQKFDWTWSYVVTKKAAPAASH